MAKVFPLLLLIALSALQAQPLRPVNPQALVEKIQHGLSASFPPPEATPAPGVPRGELIHASLTDSKIYPGAFNAFDVYVPAQYNPARPACLLVKLDGLGTFEAAVLDSLIAGNEVPVLIGVGIVAGTVWKDPEGTPKRAAYRFNRSYEFDSLNDRFPGYVLDELLPAVQKLTARDGRPLKISPAGNDHAATGASTGGIGSFTLAWRRPDQFTRVYSLIGTYVSMRGGHEYPALIRKTDPKPIRLFLEDGSADAWNPLFGSWYEANLLMESALTFAGYDVAHAWGTHGHDSRPGQVILPDVLRWLWRDYPSPVATGISRNSTLREITLPAESWKMLPQSFRAAAGLAASPAGAVYLTDPSAQTVYRLTHDTQPAVFRQGLSATALAFGPDGTLYAAAPALKKILALTPHGELRTVADAIAAHSLTVTHDGALYASEPGLHPDTPSRLWHIRNGRKTLIDRGLSSASGVALSPDASLFYAAEKSTKWIYSYILQPDGTLRYKQPYFWLHMPDVPNESGAQALAADIHGNLYVATHMGIQVCDHNGRVRAILPLPTPSGSVRGLCFGGDNFDILYATDGTRVFTRRLKLPGYAPWAKPIAVTSQGPG